MAATNSKKVVHKQAPRRDKANADEKPAHKKRAAGTGKRSKVPPENGADSREELVALRKPVEAAKAALDAARKEAEKAGALAAKAKEAYREALAPYRLACRKAGVKCEFEGGRRADVSERVTFLVEKTGKGIRVMIKGRPKTEEVIPLAVLKASINKAAYGYVERHVGPKEKVGNKGGSLSNRLRAALA